MSNSIDGMMDYQNDNAFDAGLIDFPESGDSWGIVPSKSLMSYKMLSESKPQQPQQQHARFRRNIIDECCKRPCPRTQMIKYCVRG
jgi:hypothetical protein